jgi:Wadjet anti plasmid transformation system JetA-like protein
VYWLVDGYGLRASRAFSALVLVIAAHVLLLHRWAFVHSAAQRSPSRTHLSASQGRRKRTVWKRRYRSPCASDNPSISPQPNQAVDPNWAFVVENRATFHTLLDLLPGRDGTVGVLANGSGIAFIHLVVSLREAGQLERILYFGDIDPAGLQIPAEALKIASGFARLPNGGRAQPRATDARAALT